jgi:serine protease AprX
VLAYSDYPGATLINNLNLIVTGPDGRRYTGNQRNGVKALVLDGRNNVEVVHISKAKSGAWTIDVVASNVTQGPQDYALVAVQV